MKLNTDYLSRIADKKLELALQASGAVLIVGPKWCGKTGVAKQFAKSTLYMQHPDFAENYLKMASLKSSELLEGETARLIDEWQDAPALWNAVRFTVDQRKSRVSSYGRYFQLSRRLDQTCFSISELGPFVSIRFSDPTRGVLCLAKHSRQ